MRTDALLDRVDFFRLDANRRLDPARRSELGQFMTPPATAQFMASMFEAKSEVLKLLDAGAGVGSLSAAFVNEICERFSKPKIISVTAYEVDSGLTAYLRNTLQQCCIACEDRGITFESEINDCDFIQESTRKLRQEMFVPVPRFNCAILNPPYKKINSDSEARFNLREIGIETSNLYTGFLSVV